MPARLAVEEIAGLVHGRATLGILPARDAIFDCATLVDGFHAAHPGIELALFEECSEPLLEKVRLGHIDLAISALGESGLEGIVTESIASGDLVVGVARDHSLAAEHWDLHTVAITQPALRSNFGLAWRQGPVSPAGMALIEYAVGAARGVFETSLAPSAVAS